MTRYKVHIQKHSFSGSFFPNTIKACNYLPDNLVFITNPTKFHKTMRIINPECFPLFCFYVFNLILMMSHPLM